MNRFWKFLKAFPEAIRCPAHLEFLELSFGFFIKRFPDACNVLAHGANQKLVGKNVAELKDADGKLFMKEMAEMAKKGGGWVDYKWSNPATKKVQAKSSYILPLDSGLFVGCGIYK